MAVRVRLSTAVERSTAGTPLFDVTVEWEYTTVPSSGTRRFACVSDQDEYNELRQDVPATSTWFMAPRPGMDARRREAYELLELTVDGRPQSIRRSTRATGQTYSVDLDEDARFFAPSPHSGATGCTSPLPNRHGAGHYAWTTQTPPLLKSRSVTPWRPHRLPASSIRQKPYQARRSPSRPLAGSSPQSGVAFTWATNDELPQTTQREAATARRAD